MVCKTIIATFCSYEYKLDPWMCVSTRSSLRLWSIEYDSKAFQTAGLGACAVVRRRTGRDVGTAVANQTGNLCVAFPSRGVSGSVGEIVCRQAH